MATIKVEGLDILNIGIDRKPRDIQNGDNAGSQYWRARYNGRGFIITDENFLNKFDAGEIAVISLAESTYEIPDPMEDGKTISRESYNLVSFATYQQVQQIEAQQGKLAIGRKNFDIEMQVLEKQALKRLDLDDKTVAKLQDAV